MGGRRSPFYLLIIKAFKFCFQASDYPVVLSLENHCSPKQQEVIAEHLQNILGDKLLTSTLGDPDVTELPSPEVITWIFSVKDRGKTPFFFFFLIF